MIKGLARIRKPEISEMKRKSAGNCYPDIVWSSTLQSGTSYYRRRLQNGSFNESYDDFTFAFSVRCVLGLNFSRWRIFAKEDCCEALRFKLSNCRLMCNRPPCLRCKYLKLRENADRCYPYWVWSETPNGSNYIEYELVNGNLNGPYNYSAAFALSVRCVPGLNHSTTFKLLKPNTPNM